MLAKVLKVSLEEMTQIYLVTIWHSMVSVSTIVNIGSYKGLLDTMS